MGNITELRVCGLDEAGRGALAGPIVIAAVVFPFDFTFHNVSPGLVVRDSKKLTNHQRQKLFEVIEKNSIQVKLEVINVQDINRKGINWANITGFERLINRIDADLFIVDGRWKFSNLKNKSDLVTSIIDADETVPATLAAGIVAKVNRDAIMKELHIQYPEYGWDKNTGHGTRQHILAIRKFNVCEYHRIQFVKTALDNSYHRKNKWWMTT